MATMAENSYAIATVDLGVVLPDLKVREHERRDPPNSMPRPPFMAGVFGSRGSGKTTYILNMLRMYDAMEAFDRVYFFSPTHQKDPKFEAFSNSGLNCKLELIDTYTHAKFDEILKFMDTELGDYEKYLVAKKAYDKFVSRKSLDALTVEELLALYQYDFNNPESSSRYKKGRPSFCIVFDDMVGDKNVYRGDSAGRVGRFALRHRHYACSVCFLSQAYRSGIPRQLRNNLSMAVFFANKSDRIKEEISEEMGSFVSPEQFVQMFNYATAEQHDAFVIDFDAKVPEHRFRKNWDQLLIPQANYSPQLGNEPDKDKDKKKDETSTEKHEPLEGGKRGKRKRRASLQGVDLKPPLVDYIHRGW